MKGEKISLNKIFQVELLTTPTKLFRGTTGTPSRSDSARALTGLTQEGEPIIKSEFCNSCNTSCHWQMMIASILLLSCLFNSLSFSGLICRSLTTVQLERTPHTPRFDSFPFFVYDFSFFSAGLSWNPEQLLCRRNQVARCCLVSPLSI